MPTPTYTPLANITLGSSAASVTFSSISQAYKDLVLIANLGTTDAGYSVVIRLNGDTGSNYSRVYMLGNGSSAVSAAQDGVSLMNLTGNLGADTTISTNLIANFMDYSATDKHKSVISRTNITAGSYPGTVANAFRWANTTNVTTAAVLAGPGSTFVSGSTFALYGIAA